MTESIERLKKIDSIVARMKMGHGLYGRDEIQALLDEIAHLSNLRLEAGFDLAALQERYNLALESLGRAEPKDPPDNSWLEQGSVTEPPHQ